MNSRSSEVSRRQAGFSLLEVMCAFAILVLLSFTVTRIFVGNVELGTRALSHRELREAADTIFRKMVYETEQYEDGEEGTLEEEYGEFAQLKGWQADRWAIYRFHLEKKLTNVVGYSPDADESLFEGAAEEDSQPVEGEEGAEGETTGIELMKMTLKIYRTGEPDTEPLLTLVTWYDPNRGQVQK